MLQELGRGIISRTDCLEMVHQFGIKEDSFNAALVHFDELNIIKYSPDILPDVVFIDSQVPFDKVFELVYHSYLLRQPTSSLDAEWKHFRDGLTMRSSQQRVLEDSYLIGIMFQVSSQRVTLPNFTCFLRGEKITSNVSHMYVKSV